MRKSYYELSVNRFPSKYWHRNIIKTARLLLKNYRVEGTILDLGCGDGLRVRMIFDDSVEILGVDSDSEMVEFARSRLNKVYLSSMEALPREVLERKYSAIILMESLEHVERPDEVLQIANELLVENGLLLVIVPLETPLFRIIWWIWTRTMGKRWRKTHLFKFKSAQQLFSLLERWFKIVNYRKTNLGCIIITLCIKHQ